MERIYQNPQEYWAEPIRAREWLKKQKLYDIGARRVRPKEELSESVLLNEFKTIAKEMGDILEVGAGDGRLIKLFAKEYRKKRCCSCDINVGLGEFIHKQFGIETFVGDVTKKLPFKNNEFDFVYTYQVIQHIRPIDINNTLNELKRITKKELWLSEGWGNLKKWGVHNGHTRHKGGGGTFYWNIDELVECKEIMTYPPGERKDVAIKMYKVKL